MRLARIAARSITVLLASALLGSVVVFGLLRLLKGDVARVMLGPKAATDDVEALRVELGLNEPLLVQYRDWIFGLARGDLGRSYLGGYSIFEEIRNRAGVTVSLAVGALLVSSLIALVAGVYSALNDRKRGGIFVDLVAQVGIAVPSFWVGILLIGFVSIRLGWLPAGGWVPWSESVSGALRSLILPTTALSLSLGAVLTVFVRSAMLDVLEEDYIRTAMARGRTRTSAALRHGVRNASVPLVTVTVLTLGGLLTGLAVIERVFNLPGLGRMLVDAVAMREVVVVQSLVFVFLLIILTLNFLMDIAYGLLDPRMHDESGS